MLGLCCWSQAFSVTSGGYSLLCKGFSLWWLLLLQSTGSRCPGFHSCGTWAQLLLSKWDLLRPGLDPMPPTLAGGFLTTGPPEKSKMYTSEFQTNIFSSLCYISTWMSNRHLLSKTELMIFFLPSLSYFCEFNLSQSTREMQPSQIVVERKGQDSGVRCVFQSQHFAPC